MGRDAAIEDAALRDVFRQESGRCVATLIRLFGDIDLAEESVQDAFVIATQQWPDSGMPPNPGGWITTTAKRRAIDRLRREATRHDRQVRAGVALDHDIADREDRDAEQPDGASGAGPMSDDRLRLIFTCCHPALGRDAQVALTLRLLGGLTTNEIARGFLVPEATMAQRIVRAKQKIRANHIPYRVPAPHELPDRVPPVLLVIYLIFNEGYSTTSGSDLVNTDLCAEALRLGSMLADLMPDDPEVIGLLALMLLTDSRRGARVDADGSMIRLADQDRTKWDRSAIESGQALVRACLRRGAPGPFQIQAAIAAVHSDAPTVEDTQWDQVVTLYDQLMVVAPSPVVALNRAIAVAELDGPAVALDLLADLDLGTYYLWHASRAEMLTRLGRVGEAADSFARAAALTDNAAERELLERRVGGLPRT